MENDIMRKLRENFPIPFLMSEDLEMVCVLMWDENPHSVYSNRERATQAQEALNQRYKQNFREIPPPLSSVHEIMQYKPS